MTNQKTTISALATVAVLYGLVVLWYVPTQPSIPIGCLLTNSAESRQPGLEIRKVGELDEVMGTTPAVGDHIIQAAGIRVRSFSDWARVHRHLRNWKVDPAAQIALGKDPTEEARQSDLSLVEYPDKRRFVRVWFLRPGESHPVDGWIKLVPPPVWDVSFTLMWFVLQMCVVVVSGVAYWSRPFDQPLRTFFALSALTLMAFVGGSHWWIISASPPLITLFAIAGIMLPAVLLHFFLLYPYPVPWVARNRVLTRWLVYTVPALSAAVVAVMILASAVLTRDLGAGPFAQTIERILGNSVRWWLPLLRAMILVQFGVSFTYYLLSLFSIRRGVRTARNALERNQSQFLLGAALVATALISYTIYLAGYRRVDFALGAARLPMFLASLVFMLAYAIGVARYKLLLIDQIISRGVWYYIVSVVIAVIFAAMIAIGAVNLLQQDLLLFGQTAPLVLVLMTSVLVLSWGRDALQRSLDRRFFREKYRLDKALHRMDRVVSNVLEPEAVSDSLLNSCRDVLQVEQAALYLRKKNRLEFRMSTASGHGSFPLQIALDPECFEALEGNAVLQRVPHGHSSAQAMLRQLRADVVHGLEIQGQLGGLLVLGAKPNNSPYSAEDLAFVSAMARITGVALHCANVQQDVARLNQDLQLKIDKIEDQDRQLSALQQELASLSKSVPTVTAELPDFRTVGIKGHGPAITHVLETVRKVAGSDSSVLLRGESGTGKELLARALHENSARRNGPLVSVHCAALSPTLLESELFGHVKGAFTDAHQDKPGRFEMAQGGTLFLDEIGDITLETQVKLLRVLQERVIEPVGSNESRKVDVRIVAATHRHLEQLIADGRFREDLFYRLNVISITLPPLRERKEDLFEIALSFLRNASEKCRKQILKFDDDALHALQQYPWPGNIRELQNVIERAVVLTESNTIRLVDLPPQVREGRPVEPAFSEAGRSRRPSAAQQAPRIAARRTSLSRGEDERASLQTALDACDGNKAEAARMLGMPRSTFFSKLKKHGLN